MQKQELDSILQPIENRLKEYLKSDLGLENIKFNKLDNPEVVMLKNFTVNIGVGGALSVLFVVSYDESLVIQLAKAFAYGEISPEEEEEVRESVASEIANIVLGNAIPHFPNDGKGVTITPPIIIRNAKSIGVGKQAKIAAIIIATEYGEMCINIVWPFISV